MIINLVDRSDQPAYIQLYDQIKGMILRGELENDHPLPSIRGLAKQCSCSVITIRKGYDKLESENYIYTKAGKGCFVKVAQDSDLESSREDEIVVDIDKLIKKADTIGIDRDRIVELVKKRCGDDK